MSQQRDDMAQPAEDGAGSEVEVENAQWLAQLGSLFGVAGEDDSVAASEAACTAMASPDDVATDV